MLIAKTSVSKLPLRGARRSAQQCLHNAHHDVWMRVMPATGRSGACRAEQRRRAAPRVQACVATRPAWQPGGAHLTPAFGVIHRCAAIALKRGTRRWISVLHAVLALCSSGSESTRRAAQRRRGGELVSQTARKTGGLRVCARTRDSGCRAISDERAFAQVCRLVHARHGDACAIVCYTRRGHEYTHAVGMLSASWLRRARETERLAMHDDEDRLARGATPLPPTLWPRRLHCSATGQAYNAVCSRGF